jgi:hypothetical protein
MEKRMNTLTNLLLFAVLAISLTGCATQPVPNDEAVSVPVDPSYLHITPNSGKITIKRDSGMGASACSTQLFVNAQPIADIDTSEKVVIYLPADDYIFGAIANGICLGSLTETSATVKAGKELTFRVGYSSNGEFSISQTAF